MHKLRLNGIGPLIANSPTDLLHDTLSTTSSTHGMLNPIDIRQFPQNTKLWDKMENTTVTRYNTQGLVIVWFIAKVLQFLIIKYI